MLQTNSGKPVYKNGHQFPSAIKQVINNAELVSLLMSSFQLNGSVSLTLNFSKIEEEPCKRALYIVSILSFKKICSISCDLYQKIFS